MTKQQEPVAPVVPKVTKTPVPRTQDIISETDTPIYRKLCVETRVQDISDLTGEYHKTVKAINERFDLWEAWSRDWIKKTVDNFKEAIK